MSYHDEPYYECDGCGEKLEGLEPGCGSWTVEAYGWRWPSYDTHYCQDCTKQREIDAKEFKVRLKG